MELKTLNFASALDKEEDSLGQWPTDGKGMNSNERHNNHPSFD